MPLLLFAAAAVLVYLPAILGGGFIRDDWFNFERRPVGHLLNVWTGDWMDERTEGGVFYRPLVRLSMMFDEALFGLGRSLAGGTDVVPGARFGWGYESPFLLHNALAHGACAWLFWLLLGGLGFHRWPRHLAAAFYLLYPTHPGAVAWASARTDLIATFWTLATLLLAVRLADSRRWWWTTALAGILALASKESGLALMLLVPACVLAVPSEHPGAVREWRRWRATALLLLLGSVYLIVRMRVFGGLGGYHRYEPLQLAEAQRNLSSILGALLLPWREGAPGGMIFTSLVVGSFLLPRPRFFLLALVWIGASVLPFVFVQATVGEGARYLHLPAAGLALLVAEAARRSPLAGTSASLAPSSPRRMAWLAVGAIALVWGVLLLVATSRHLGAWVVAAGEVRQVIKLSRRACMQLEPDASLVPLNPPVRFRSAYVSDYWSLEKALTYLGAPGHGQTIPSLGMARDRPVYALVLPSPDADDPRGVWRIWLDSFVPRATDAPIVHGHLDEAWLMRVGNPQRLDLTLPDSLRAEGEAALYLPLEDGVGHRILWSSVSPERQPFTDFALSHHPPFPGHRGPLLLVGPGGAALHINRSLIRRLRAGIAPPSDAPPAVPGLYSMVMKASAREPMLVIGEAEDGDLQAARALPLQSRHLMLWEQVGPDGPFLAEQSFAAWNLEEARWRIPSPGGWIALESLELLAYPATTFKRVTLEDL